MKPLYLFASILTVIAFSNDSSAQAPNTWTQKANFGGTPRLQAVGFSIGTKGYIGTGGIGGFVNDFWEYDPSSNTWTQKANFGGTPRYGAVGFSIGAYGYIGTGYDTSDVRRDFWKYDPSSNTWTQKASFGGTARYEAVGFSIGTKGYIGTGEDTSSNFVNDFWEYNPTTDTWTQKANFGGTPREYAVGFSIGAYGYIGTGYDNTIGVQHDFWEYDPSVNIWTQKANFGGLARIWAVGFSIGSLGYIGTGENDFGTFCNDFWEYNPTADFWTQKANFGGTARKEAVGYSIGTQGYIGTGYDGSDKNDFWQYTPTCVLPNAPTNTTPPTNQNICTGHSTTLSASGTGSLGWYNAATGGTWLGGGTSYTTPILTTSTTYYVQDSTCGPSPTRTSIPVTVNPLPVPTITGQTSMCVNSGYYNYSTEANMTNYAWTVSLGGIINYGSGTNQIQVSWIIAGPQTVSVTYTTTAGCSPLMPTVLNVMTNPLPGVAGPITGNANVCAGANGIVYSVSPIPNTTTYLWALPPNATIISGAGTNTITVDFSANASSGDILVLGNNICGDGNVSPGLLVTVNPIPPTPVVTNRGDTLFSSAPSGNQWYFEGNLIIGGISQTYVATQDGNYWDVVDLNGCLSDTSNHKLILITGMNSQSESMINVYPVPNEGRFNISITTLSDESFSINVYNTLGTSIYEESNFKVSGSLQKVIDLRPLPNGVYTLIIKTDQKQVVKKIVVNQ